MNIRGIIQNHYLDQLPTRALQMSNIFRFLASLILGMALVRLGVSQHDVGRVEWLFFISYFWSALWHLGLKDSLLSKYNDYELGERKYAFFDFYFLHIIAAILTVVIMMAFISSSITFGLEANGLGNVMGLVVCYAGLLTLAAPLDFYLHLSDRHHEVVGYNLVWFIAHVAIVIYGMVVEHSVLWMTTGLCILIGIKVLLTWMVLMQESAVRWKASVISALGIFSIPLILQSLVGVSTQAVDSFLVEHFFDTSTYAVFRFGAKEIPLSMLLVTGLVAASIPMYKKNAQQALDHMMSEFRKMVKMLFPLGIALTILSPFLFKWIYGVEYIESATIFNIYILLLISRLFLPHVILYGSDRNWVMVTTTTIEVVLNAVLSILFIQFFGLVGVAYATVVAYLFQKVVYILYVKHKLGVPSSAYTDWPLLMKYSAVLLIVFASVQIIYPHFGL